MSKFRERRRKSRIYDNIYFYIVTIFICIMVTTGFIKFIGYRTVVHGESMEATLFDKESVFVNKISYQVIKPKRYDVIVFHKPKDAKTLLVKRVIGLPGDRIKIENGTVFVNGQRIKKDTSKDGYTIPVDMTEEITVHPYHYFVLGDNRGNSMDSRDERIGCISQDSIEGKVSFVMYPWTKIGMVR